MDKKLTLKLDKKVIDRAKKYASNHKISLSRMIENYLESVTREEHDISQITPLVKSLSGVISVDENFDHKEEYSSHLADKYK